MRDAEKCPQCGRGQVEIKIVNDISPSDVAKNWKIIDAKKAIERHKINSTKTSQCSVTGFGIDQNAPKLQTRFFLLSRLLSYFQKIVSAIKPSNKR